MDSFKDLPDLTEIELKLKKIDQITPLKVNSHFHTPYSFSAFSSIGEAFDMADKEDVSVLGITDFITTDGYDEFFKAALTHNKFPLFCIEFMGLMRKEQSQGILVNDPTNPGRTYFCGKGLSYPVKRSAHDLEILQNVFIESEKQVKEMVRLLGRHLDTLNAPFSLPFEKIKNHYAKKLVRERHIAKALRIEIKNSYTTTKEQKEFISRLFDGREIHVNLNDSASLDNELRNHLLKSGGKAFVPEDDKAFLEIEDIRDWIIRGGGIPSYPVLLDNNHGEFTDYERDPAGLLNSLQKKNVHAIELIPGRNDLHIFKNLVHFFYKKGYLITFGTEHNTPVMQPMTITCRNGVALDAELMQISYLGACVVAANQYLIAKGHQGYINPDGSARSQQRSYFEKLGDAVIRTFINEKTDHKKK